MGGEGRTALSVRTRVHRRAKVAAREYSIYFLTNVNVTNNTLVPRVRFSFVSLILAREIYTRMDFAPILYPFFNDESRVWITALRKKRLFGILSFVVYIIRSPRVKWKIDPVTTEI